MTKDHRAFSEFLTRADKPLLTPKGMGDLLPGAAAARRALSQRLVGEFELAGYRVVIPPLFEHASVVERGNESIDPRDLLRFVEPESGEVAVLRPDITPQIARMVATRLSDHPPPYRLCYEGRVLRRRRGRARKQQQVAQVGVECVGIDTPAGDVEVIALASDACEAVGLQAHRIELGEASLIGSVLADVPAGVRNAAIELIAKKDGAALRSFAKDHGVTRRTADRLTSLLDHFGDRQVLSHARRAFRWDAAQAALRNLETITERLAHLGLGDRVGIDLSEVRGLSYYSGVSFQLLAAGPGEAIGSGGRYDGLLERFGQQLPATGFALDLVNIEWALRQVGRVYTPEPVARVLIAGGDELEREVVARKVRTSGLAAAPGTSQNTKDALAFAASWGYDVVLALRASGLRAVRVSDGAQQTVKQLDPDALAALAAWSRGQEEEI